MTALGRLTAVPPGQHPDRALSAARGIADLSDVVDIEVGRMARIRLIDATVADRAAVERQFGPARPATRGPADLQIRYVDHIADDCGLRYLGPGEQGFTADGLYVLRGRFRRPVRVRLPLRSNEANEIVCEHGVGRVPHLVALVNLAVLAAGGVALHASSFELDGAGLVATGWSKGGKTEALLAASLLGARYVADEWSHLYPDGSVSGIREPIRLWDWHLAQLPDLRAALPATDRRRLAALRRAHKVARAITTSPRLSTMIDRQRYVDAPPEIIARNGRVEGSVPVRGVFLMSAADQPSCTRHPIGSDEVADRMAASLAYERLPLIGVLAAHRYAFPAAATASADELFRRERGRLRHLLRELPVVEVRHPHHVDLHELGTVIVTESEAWS